MAKNIITEIANLDDIKNRFASALTWFNIAELDQKVIAFAKTGEKVSVNLLLLMSITGNPGYSVISEYIDTDYINILLAKVSDSAQEFHYSITTLVDEFFHDEEKALKIFESEEKWDDEIFYEIASLIKKGLVLSANMLIQFSLLQSYSNKVENAELNNKFAMALSKIVACYKGFIDFENRNIAKPFSVQRILICAAHTAFRKKKKKAIDDGLYSEDVENYDGEDESEDESDSKETPTDK